MKMMIGRNLRPAFRIHPAEDLRPPVMDAAEEAHDRAAHHHVVEVRDHEIGIGQVHVHSERGEEQARQSADREQPDKTDARTASASSAGPSPLYIVAVQLKTLIADGIATM